MKTNFDSISALIENIDGDRVSINYSKLNENQPFIPKAKRNAFSLVARLSALFGIVAVCFLMLPNATFAQVSAVGTIAGTTPVNYTTLNAAFTAINTGTHTGVITVSITGNTTETASAILNASGSGSASYTTISIQPSGGAARTVSGAIAAGLPLIDLNGADNVTIDGLNTGGNSLTFSNTTVSATSGTSTLYFRTDATANTITNCSILGSSTVGLGTSGGNIWFGSGALSTGNDGNTISNCNVGPAGTNLPLKLITFTGSSNNDPGSANSGNLINNNNFYDWFSAASASTAIDINSGSTNFTISNNRFYQTASRTHTSGVAHSAIYQNNANGYLTITGNIIGYASSTGTGTYTLVGVSGSRFIPIFMNSCSTTTATSLQGNTIAGIAMSGAMASTSSTSSLIGIYVASGLTTIGNITGNTIGSMSATGSITYTSSSTSASDVNGIYNFGTSNWTTNNNNIGGFTVANSSTGATNFYGLRCNTGSTVTWTCTGNTIGGTVANSISSTSTATATIVNGILNSNPLGTFTGNSIRNMTVAGGTGTTTTASLVGLCITGSVNQTISQNTIFNLSNTNTTAATIVTGIQFTGGSANIVERNFIYGLTSATNSASAELNGIRVGGGTTTYRNNMIVLGAGISNALGAAATNSATTGINGFSGVLGTDNFWHNSVYIGGTATAGTGASYAFNGTQTFNTRSFRNNIFVNARTNSGATGKHYAIKINGTVVNPTGLTINNNIYFTSGTGGVFGFYASLDVANLAAWQTAIGQDAASLSSNPQFINPTSSTPDLHINTSAASPADAAGANLGVTNDFDGDTRSGLSPIDIGADAFINNILCTTPISPTDNQTGVLQTASLSWNAAAGATSYDVYFGTDAAATNIVNGVNQSGTTYTPATLSASTIYYWKIVPKNSSSTATGCTIWSFTTGAAVPSVSCGTLAAFGNVCVGSTSTANSFTVSGLNLTGDLTVNALTGYTYSTTSGGTYTSTLTLPNVGGVVSTTVFVKLSPTAAISYNGNISVTGGGATAQNVAASGTGLPAFGGIYTVGSGGNYATLTTAVNAYNTATCFTANVVFNLLDATYSGSETFPITINSNPNSGSFTLLIKPNTGVTAAITGSNASPLIRFNGVDLVTIDGSNNGSSTRNLTITNTNTIASTTAIALISLGTGAGATNNTIKNCLISTGNTGTSVSYGIHVGGATIPSSGADNDNVTIQNNAFSVATIGVYAYGTAATTSGGIDNLNVSGNSILINSSSTSVYGVQLGNSLMSNIVGNTFDIQTSGSGQPVGISVETGNTGTLISKNVITKVLTTATGGYGGRGITLGTGSTSSNITVSNNMISGVNGSNYSGFNNSSSMGIGIGMIGNSTTFSAVCGGINIYHNTISLSGSYSYATACLTAALYIGTTGSAINVLNNIFHNSLNNTNASGTSSKNYAIYSVAANTAFTAIDNNDYFVSGTQGVLGYLSSDLATLSAITTGFGGNGNSVNVVPNFISVSDLHLIPGSNTSLNNSGALGTGISDDIDGDVRCPGGGCPGATAKPDMGADEFSPPQDDAGVISFVGASFCAGTQTVQATVQNFGAATLNTFSVSWSVNGTSQGAVNFMGQNIATGATGVVTLGLFNFASATNYVLVASSSLPNGNPDAITTNDQFSTPTFQTGLSGTYTVGAGGNFTTLTAAVIAANATGLCGPTIFSLTDATYSASETFPITINQLVGSSAINTLTVLPAVGVTAAITGSNAAAIIKINGGDFVTIDGSNNGTTTRNLSVINTNSANTSSGIWLASVASPANGATNNTIKNITITGNDPNTTFACIASSAGIIGNTSDIANANNTFENNLITASYYGIVLAGFASGETNNVVRNNVIGSNVTTGKIGVNGIFISNQTTLEVSGNTILGVNSTTNILTAGVYVVGTISGGTITKNKISDIKNTLGNGRQAMGIWLEPSSTVGNLTISNNMIFDIANSGNSAVLSRSAHGIYIATGSGYNIYNNSVNLNTNPTAANTAGKNAALYVASGVTNLNVRNNIFANSQTTAVNRYAIYSDASNTAFSTINYNNYSSSGSGLGFIGSARITLADIVTGFGQNANSSAETPVFISVTDLHLNLSLNFSLDNTGTPIASVTSDIDGDVRSVTTPDMGADEFTSAVCTSSNGGTITAVNTTLCNSGSTTLSATGYSAGTGTTYEWEKATTLAFTIPISMATPTSIYGSISTGVISATTYYRLKVICSAGVPSYSNVLTITLNNPSVLSTAPSTTCGTGPATLGATGSAGTTLNWYAAATGGSSLGAGTSFVTPSISATTNYFVAANAGGAPNETFGRLTPVDVSGFGTTNWGVVFSASAATTLISTTIYPDANGTVTISLQNSAGVEIAVTSPITVTGNTGMTLANDIALNFSVPIGTGYRLLMKSYTGVSNFRRELSGSVYPYSSANYSVTSSWSGSSTSSSYYFFYNIVAGSACESARTQVTATVNPAPAVTLSTAATPICSGTPSAPITIATGATDYDIYTWSPIAGVSGNAASGWTFNPTVNTNYTLNVSQSAGICVNSVPVSVTVNPIPTNVTAATSVATICEGATVDLTSSAVGNDVVNLSYTEGFESGLPTGWTVINAGSGNNFVAGLPNNSAARTGVNVLQYNFNVSAAANTWAFTKPFNLVAGVTYTVSSWYRTYASNSWTESFKVTVGSAQTVASQTTTISTITSVSTPSGVYLQQSGTFTPTSSGVYYFAWNCFSAVNQFLLSIDDISISGSYSPTPTFAWTSSPAGFTSSTQNPTSVAPTVTTTYTVEATNGFSCKATKDVTVTVKPKPTSTITSVSSTLCHGNDYKLEGTINATGAWTLTLNPGSLSVTGTGSGTWEKIVTPTATPTTTYTVTNIADVSGCVLGSLNGSTVLTLPATTASLAPSDNATCIVKGSNWVHFYSASGKLIVSINPNGNDLGSVVATSYVDPGAILTQACGTTNPAFTSAALGRRWVITPTITNLGATVRFPYDDGELSALITASAGTTANSLDNVSTLADLQLSKYNGANENGSWSDNCGNGSALNFMQTTVTSNDVTTANNFVNTISGSSFVQFSIPSFSEFWLLNSKDPSALPVELLDFAATCTAQQEVNVGWSTASELNSQKFIVEKSRDLNHWIYVNEMNAAGNSTHEINYNILDSKPFGETSYYRLVQVDNDGVEKIYGPISVSCANQDNSIIVFPNPTQGSFTVEITSSESFHNAEIQVFDITGKLISMRKVNIVEGKSQILFESSTLQMGTYIVKLISGNQFTPVKVVVN